MQQGRVIRVLQVLVVHLPVAGQLVLVEAENTELLAVEHGVEIVEDVLRQVVFERLHVMLERGIDHAVPRCDRKLPEAVFLVLEVLRHAAELVDTALERDALEIALEIVGPLVIRANELGIVASRMAAEFGATMRAAVLEYMDGAVFGARDDDRCRSDVRALEVAAIGDFRFERNEVPGMSMENPLDLAGIDLFTGVDPVGNGTQALVRPHKRLDAGILGPGRTEANHGFG